MQAMPGAAVAAVRELRMAAHRRPMDSKRDSPATKNAKKKSAKNWPKEFKVFSVYASAGNGATASSAPYEAATAAAGGAAPRNAADCVSTPVGAGTKAGRSVETQAVATKNAASRRAAMSETRKRGYTSATPNCQTGARQEPRQLE